MEWIILILVLLAIFSYISRAHEDGKREDRKSDLTNILYSINGFRPSKQINGFGGLYLFAIDNYNEKLVLITEQETTVFKYEEVIGVEIIEDGSTMSKKSTSRTIGGAIVGGVLAGGVGSIVGGLSGSSKQKNKVKTLFVKILLKDIEHPSVIVKCFESRTMTYDMKESLKTEGDDQSNIYQQGKKDANDIKDLVTIVIDKVDSKVVNNQVEKPQLPSQSSVATEILKLNELKEKGIITESEFNDQKIKLLNS